MHDRRADTRTPMEKVFPVLVESAPALRDATEVPLITLEIGELTGEFPEGTRRLAMHAAAVELGHALQRNPAFQTDWREAASALFPDLCKKYPALLKATDPSLDRIDEMVRAGILPPDGLEITWSISRASSAKAGRRLFGDPKKGSEKDL